MKENCMQNHEYGEKYIHWVGEGSYIDLSRNHLSGMC